MPSEVILRETDGAGQSKVTPDDEPHTYVSLRLRRTERKMGSVRNIPEHCSGVGCSEQTGTEAEQEHRRAPTQ